MSSACGMTRVSPPNSGLNSLLYSRYEQWPKRLCGWHNRLSGGVRVCTCVGTRRSADVVCGDRSPLYNSRIDLSFGYRRRRAALAAFTTARSCVPALSGGFTQRIIRSDRLQLQKCIVIVRFTCIAGRRVAKNSKLRRYW